MLSSNPDFPIDSAITYSGMSALSVACCQSDDENGNVRSIIELILSANPNIEIIDSFGKTPIHHASHNCFNWAILRLIESGSKINS